MNNITNIFEPYKDVWFMIIVAIIGFSAAILLIWYIVKKIRDKFK